MTPKAGADPPAWWQALQDDFASFLRTPLRDDGGRLRSGSEAAAALLPRVRDDEGVGAARRLALYHEQYWMRLFSVLQQALPRTCRVVGAFTFNRLASAFVVARGPRGFDLDELAREFSSTLRATLEAVAPPPVRAMAPHGVVTGRVDVLTREVQEAALLVPAWWALLHSVPVPWSMLAQALSLDEACRRAFEAPPSSGWAITDEEIAAVMSSRARVIVAPSFSLVRVDWAIDNDGLVAPTAGNAAVNAAPDDRLPEAAAGAPDGTASRCATAMHHVVVHRLGGVRHGVVDAVLARVLARLRRERFDELRRHFEEKLPPGASTHLERSFAGYARLAAAEGWWVGVRQTLEPT